MKTTTTSGNARPHRIALLGAMALVAGACSPAIESVSATGGNDFVTGIRQLAGGNGLTLNGLNSNGLNSNGLNSNGLGTTKFKSWFSANVATSDAIMKYL